MVAGACVAKKRFGIGFARRKLLIETYYVDHLNTSVCLELALRDDLPLVIDYLRSEYGNQKTDSAWIKGDESFTIIARDNSYICGVLRGTVVDHEKSENQLDSVFKDVPSDTERFFHVDCLQVDIDYQGSGLGTRLWTESLKLAINVKCQYVTSLCPVGVSMVVANKVGMRLAKNASNEAEPANNGAYLMIYDLNDAAELIARDLIPKVPEAYRLKQAERPLIHSVFVKQLEREIKMELAVPGDEPILQNYVINEFFKQTPLYVTLGFQTEDARELARNRLSPDLIADGRVIMVTDNSQLVGIMICRNVVVDRSPLKYDLLSSDVIDLTEDISKMPHVLLPIAKYRAVTSLINAQMSFCIPADSGAENFCVLQMGHLHANYRHYKLGLELGSAGLMLSYQKGHRFVQSMTTSIGADRQTQASGAKRMFDCPYSKFEYNGQPIFVDGKLCDGYDKATIFQMDLTEL